MIYVKNTQKDTPYISVNHLIQPKKNNVLSVMPPYTAAVQAKTVGSLNDMDKAGTESLSGKQSGILQKKSIAAVVSSRDAAADPNPEIDPPKPGMNKTGFIDMDEGANIRTRPAESGGEALTSQPLPQATRVFVGGQHPESSQWVVCKCLFLR